MLVFAVHNLIKEPPFLKMDLISARNLLIYLKNDLQKRVIPLFHYSLNENGLLFLSPSETVGEFGDLFTSLDRKWKLYQRKAYASANGRTPPFPFQESLTNVARHAKASEVKVWLSHENGNLCLEVSDNGVGFESSPEKKSTGLTGMRERALALRGGLTIDSKNGQGTRVIAKIPMEKE